MAIMYPTENKEGKLCDHGCGQIAKFRNATGKLCCCESFYQCPGYKKRQSDNTKKRPPSVPKGTRLKDKSGICEICGKEHDGRYGSGRYCSSECAHKASVIHTDMEATNKKRSQTLKSRSEDEIYQSVLLGAITYNKNHPNNQIELPKKGSRVCVYLKNKKIIRKYKEPCRICGQIGCPEPEQCTHMKRLNLEKFSNVMDLSRLGSLDIYIEYEKLRQFLFDKYINLHMSTPDIAKIFNINWVSVMFLIQKFNIPKRNRSESAIYTLLNHPEKLESVGKNQYQCGYHTSWEGKTFWYRSSYELDYAKQLDNAEIHYEVENLRMIYWSSIKNRQSIMISDFYLPETNTIVEVKGDFTYIEQDWKDRLAVLVPMGYNCKLLLEHQWYGIDNIPTQKTGANITNLLESF